MIDARRHVCLLKGGIGSYGPPFSHMNDLADSRPHSAFAAPRVVPFKRGFCAQSFQSDFAGGREQMSMKIPGIAARIITGCMDCNIHREPVAFDQFTGKPFHQFSAFLRREFRRQRYQIFPRHSRVFSYLSGFRGVPKSAAILSPRHIVRSEFLGQNDLFVQNVLAFRVVVGPAGSLIAKALAGSIRGSTYCAAAICFGQRISR